MDIYNYIENEILNITGRIESITISPCRNLKHGDIATNAPIILAKMQNKTKEEVGKLLSKKMASLPEISTIGLAGAGFLNITIKNQIWHQILSDINQQGSECGSSNLGKGGIINVESVSANPTGPLHIGHARSAIFFEALSKLFEKVGYKVVREYYINDAGSQIEALVDSVLLRYKEVLGEPFPDLAPYPGEYLKPIGKKLVEEYNDTLLTTKDAKNIIKDFALSEIMISIKADLRVLGIKHDIFVSEASLHYKIQEAIKILDDKGLIYRGSLTDPKGKKKDDWEEHDHLLFRSTQFGDESDRSLQKADGSWTYFAADIAYHLDKLNRGFTNMVLGLGLDHAGYVSRLKGALKALSDEINISIKLYNIVHLFEDGKALKMSKRSGKFLTLKDLINEVGADVVKYMMLTRRHDVVLDLDLNQVKEQSHNNPVFYVQYAHARACSVLRQIDCSQEVDLKLLASDAELSLIKLVAKWPKVVRDSVKTYEPHRITNYLQEVAESFHALWHFGNKNSSLKFIVTEDEPLTRARAELVKAVKNTLASGLNVLSIEAKDSM